MIRRPYHRKWLADLENLARSGVKSGAVITPSSPAVLSEILSIWPQSVGEWKFPFRLLSQFGSLDPWNLGVEWQFTNSDSSRRRLVGPLNKIIHVNTHRDKEVEKTGKSMSAQFVTPSEATIYNLLPPSPISICMVGLRNLLRLLMIVSMKRGRRRRSVSRVLALEYDFEVSLACLRGKASLETCLGSTYSQDMSQDSEMVQKREYEVRKYVLCVPSRSNENIV